MNMYKYLVHENRGIGLMEADKLPASLKIKRARDGDRTPSLARRCSTTEPLAHNTNIKFAVAYKLAPTKISISDFIVCVNLFLQISCNFSATSVISSPANHKINRYLYHQKSAKNRPPCKSCEKITPFTRQSFSFN